MDLVEFASHPDEVPAGWTPYTVPTGIGCSGDFVWEFNLPYSNANVTGPRCKFNQLNWAFSNLAIEAGGLVFSKNGASQHERGNLAGG